MHLAQFEMCGLAQCDGYGNQAGPIRSKFSKGNVEVGFSSDMSHWLTLLASSDAGGACYRSRRLTGCIQVPQLVETVHIVIITIDELCHSVRTICSKRFSHAGFHLGFTSPSYGMVQHQSDERRRHLPR